MLSSNSLNNWGSESGQRVVTRAATPQAAYCEQKSSELSPSFSRHEADGEFCHSWVMAASQAINGQRVADHCKGLPLPGSTVPILSSLVCFYSK